MKLTAKARYAVMAITDIALYGTTSDGVVSAVSLSDISIRQSISLSFLEQLFSKLRKAGIVQSVRGAAGGYSLSLPPEEIYIGAIIHAVHETVQTKRCTGDEGLGCTSKGAKCLSHDLWQAMEDHIELFLASISIADVVAQKFPVLNVAMAQQGAISEMTSGVLS